MCAVRDARARRPALGQGRLRRHAAQRPDRLAQGLHDARRPRGRAAQRRRVDGFCRSVHGADGHGVAPAAGRVPQVAADAPFLLREAPAPRRGVGRRVGQGRVKRPPRGRRRRARRARRPARAVVACAGRGERALLPAAAAATPAGARGREQRAGHRDDQRGDGIGIPPGAARRLDRCPATGAATGGGCLRGGVGGGRLSVWVSLHGERQNMSRFELFCVATSRSTSYASYELVRSQKAANLLAA